MIGLVGDMCYNIVVRRLIICFMILLKQIGNYFKRNYLFGKKNLWA